jgi:hypothetical protein
MDKRGAMMRGEVASDRIDPVRVLAVVPSHRSGADASRDGPQCNLDLPRFQYKISQGFSTKR